MKKFIVAGNWKLNGSNIFTFNFISKLQEYLLVNSIYNKIVLAPPIMYANNIKNNIQHEKFFLAAQNVDINISGAFTGDISASMLKDIGVKYVIIGHSERRKFHQENDLYIAKKFKIIKNQGLIPILCIGENIDDHSSNKTEIICRKQIDKVFQICGKHAFKNSIIAYEPIWAIGSGNAASIKSVKKVNQFIKTYIFDNSIINKNDIIVQYGGSVNENNIQSFFEQEEIDGVLLGNSSLIYDTFIKIINYVNLIKI